MTTIRTEPKIKKERVAVYVSLGLAFAAIGAIVPMMSTTAFAQEPNCWGQETKELADDETGAVGAHASDPIEGDADRETPRAGLPNVLTADEEGNLPIPRTPMHPSEVGAALDDCE